MVAQDLIDVASKNELIHELTRRALDHMDDDAWTNGYDTRKAYASPLQNPVFSQANTWDNNWIPNNAMKTIRSFDTIAEGVHELTWKVIENYERVSGHRMDDEGVYAVYQIVASRWGVGAVGEEFQVQLHKDAGREIVELGGEMDIDGKVDVATKDGYKDQVKLKGKRSNTYPHSAPSEANRKVWITYTEDGLKQEVVADER